MIPKQRNAGNWRGEHSEPSWCTGVHDPTRRVHKSAPVKVGDKRDGGQVTIWLKEIPGRPTVVGLNAAHMGGLSIEVPPAVAAELVAKLTDLLDLARER